MQEKSGVKYLNEGKNYQPRILTLRNYPSKVKEKYFFQTNTSWGNALPADLPCRNYYKKFFREKENNMG